MNSNQMMAEQQQQKQQHQQQHLDDDHLNKYDDSQCDDYEDNHVEMSGSHDDDNAPDQLGAGSDNLMEQQQQQHYDSYDEPRLKMDPMEQNLDNGEGGDFFDESEGNPSDFVAISQDNNTHPMQVQESSYNQANEDPEDLAPIKTEQAVVDPNLWTLPADKDVCTLEEIRRGQVINRVAGNECPVPGCGKKINESSLEPSPGTIASGLRTHVLFVHYANRKGIKKRKLGWTNKRRSSASPRKQFVMPNRSSPMSNADHEFDTEHENLAFATNDMHPPLSSGSSLIQRGFTTQNRSSPPGSLLSKKIKQLSAGQTTQQQQSSIHSLMQATGMNFGNNNGTKYSPQSRQKGQDLSKTFNQTTSSLFSILAGLTQQQQQGNQRSNLGAQSQQSTQPRNVKAAHSGNTINVSQCSKNNNFSSNNNNHNINNNNNNAYANSPPMNSSLMTLLNDRISGNVASSLQSQLKKTLESSNQGLKVPNTSTSRTTVGSLLNHNYPTNNSQNDNHNFNNGSSILSSLCANNGDYRIPNDSSSSLNPFVESIARKTGSNIGPAGIAEAKKIIDKFTTWLICSSQTIADHYIAPYANEAPQQKPEISASDVILAYKMMQKSHPQ